MAADMMKIALIFTGVNRLGGVLSSIGGGLDKVSKKIEKINKIGSKMMMAGAGMAGGTAAGVLALLKNFGEFEASQLDFENTMLQSNGRLLPQTQKILAIATKMGDILPGSTEDFIKMAGAMKSAGTGAESLANGSLDAASKLGALLLKRGYSFEDVGQGMSRMQQTLKVTDGDMYQFADTIQRAVYAGADFNELSYGFKRVAGALDAMQIKGIKAASVISPILTMLTKEVGGEAGNSLADVLMKGFQLGKWKDIEGALSYLERLKKSMNSQQYAAAMSKMFGSGSPRDVAIKLGSLGVGGYAKLQKEMADQASLDQRSKRALGGLLAMYEGLTGTLSNVAAAFGSIFGDEAKVYLANLNGFAVDVKKWGDANKPLVNILAKVTFGLGALLFAGGGVMRVIGFARTVLPAVGSSWLMIVGVFSKVRNAVTLFSTVFRFAMFGARAAMITTGIGALVVGLGIAALLIYENWDKVKAFFIGLWSAIKPYVQPIMDFFAKLWGMVTGVVGGIGKFMGMGAAAQTVRVPSMPVRSLPPGTTGRGVGSTVVNYSPTINGAVGTKADMRALLDSHAKQISGIVQQQNQRQARRAY